MKVQKNYVIFFLRIQKVKLNSITASFIIIIIQRINNIIINENLIYKIAFHFLVKKVYYPKYITPEIYSDYKNEDGGYGGLFSLTFHSLKASQQFFDSLPIAKGPSLGTNFTLACPYTILAHYFELDWAAKFGVEVGLVRVSVGLEDKETLLEGFQKGLDAITDE